MKYLARLFRRLLLMLVIPALCVAAGWYLGARYGAPPAFVAAIDSALASGRAVLTPILGEAARKGGDAAKTAAREGGDYVVGTVEQMFRDRSGEPDTTAAPDRESPAAPGPKEERLPAPSPDPLPAPAISGDAIVLCKMQISNQPRQGEPGSAVGKANETAQYKGARLLLMPATKACLSSGYGYRNGKLHKGVDYFSDMGGDAVAAGAGTVVEAVSRADYGEMVVIDHGNGVYTRYAHLARLGAGVTEGAAVSPGQTLGPIGRTGATSITHLHYEVLTGDYDTRAGSFGLEAVDPFGL